MNSPTHSNEPTQPDEQSPESQQPTQRLEDHIRELNKKLNESQIILQAHVVEALYRTRTYRYGRWLVMTLLGLGVAAWVGGTVFSGFQMTSIQQQSVRVNDMVIMFQDRVEGRLAKITEQTKNLSDKANDKIKNLNTKAKKATTRITKLEQKANTTINNSIQKVTGAEVTAIQSLNKSRVDERLDRHIKDIIRKEKLGKKLGQVKDAAKKATGDINSMVVEVENTKNAALKKLNVKELPDLSTIQKQIKGLEQQSGDLNLRNIRFFVNSLTSGALFISIIAIVVCGIMIFKLRKDRKNSEGIGVGS